MAARRARAVLPLVLAGLLTAPAPAQELRRWAGTLPGVRNAREVSGWEGEPGKWMRERVLARAGTLVGIDEDGLRKLREYGVGATVELRTWEEIALQGAGPAPFCRKPMLVHLPVKVERWSNDMSVNMVNLWKENAVAIASFLELVADPDKQPVLLLDDDGVIRTGLFAAAVMELAGIDRAEIVQDFTKNVATREIEPAWLQSVFALWDEHPQGLEGWLVERAGVEPATVRAVRHTLYEAEPFVESADEEKAAKALAKAEFDAAKGRYAKAASAYRKLAEKYPDTRAGRKAAKRARPNALVGWKALVENGRSDNRVDVVVLGDGYLLQKQDTFDQLASRVPTEFERHPLFGEYFAYHNFTRGNLASEEDGIDANQREYSTALDGKESQYSQGQATVDSRLVRNFLAQLPDDDGLAVVFVRAGSAGTGGGGVATIGGGPSNTMFHEWGHAFAGLMDEYSTDVGYRGGVRDGVNVAKSPDEETLPWKHWIDAGRKGVGAYEGAAGRARGAWKATTSGCAMASGRDFCVVCREQFVLVIHRYVDPIEACEPAPHPLDGDDPFLDPVPPLRAAESLDFELTVLEPANHDLDVRWWVLPAAAAPPLPQPLERRLRFGDRRDRGPLGVLEGAPTDTTKAKRGGRHRFTLDPAGLAPGRYRVVARARDPTQWKGEDWPWVLRDRHGLLESERAWWVVVPE